MAGPGSLRKLPESKCLLTRLLGTSISLKPLYPPPFALVYNLYRTSGEEARYKTAVQNTLVR
jgi:hypothetical protein